MITIITGKINTGKTTRIKDYHQTIHKGDGIVSRKIMLEDRVYGFNGIRLTSNFEFLFMIHEQFSNQNSDEDTIFEYAYDIGPYHILKNGLDYIDKAYQDIISSHISPVFFDEIGVLELQDLGFAQHISNAIKNDLDIVMTIREDLVSKIVSKFEIHKYEVIK